MFLKQCTLYSTNLLILWRHWQVVFSFSSFFFIFFLRLWSTLPLYTSAYYITFTFLTLSSFFNTIQWQVNIMLLKFSSLMHVIYGFSNSFRSIYKLHSLGFNSMSFCMHFCFTNYGIVSVKLKHVNTSNSLSKYFLKLIHFHESSLTLSFDVILTSKH